MSSVPSLSQQNEYNVTVPPSNAGVTHPASIAVNVQDSKASQGFSQGLTENDRQHPDDTANQLHHYPQKHDHDAKWWTYRVLVGKDYKEFQIEKEKKKPIDWIIQEFTVHLAEFIGTMFLIIFVAGIQVNQDFFPDGGVANIDKGMVSGLILTGLIYSFGKVSGAHFNPLVTLAFLLRGSFHILRAITYISVQFAGAVSGAALLYHWFGNVGPGLGTTTPGAGVKDYAAVEIEMLMTFILITVILATTERGSKILSAVSGLAVGMTFGAVEIWAWNFTGASVNPWRTIGPTMISNYGWDTYWIYLVGTSSGMFLAVIVQRVMMTGVKHEKKKQAEIKAALKAQAKAEAQARA